MSKILVVEPSLMLQHAFVHALFPDHSVEIVADLSAAALRAAEADLLIVDAATLHQRGASASETAAAMRRLNRPAVRVDTGPVASDTIAPPTLSLPFSREELCSMIAKVLRPTASAAPSEEAGAPTRQRRASKSEPASATGRNSKEIIELVDVIEEPAGAHDAGAGSGN